VRRIGHQNSGINERYGRFALPPAFRYKLDATAARMTALRAA